MTTPMFPRWVLVVATLCAATPAAAQTDTISGSRCDTAPSVHQLFAGTVKNFGQLSRADSLGIVAIGGLAAVGASHADTDLRRTFSAETPVGDPFKPGAVLGGTPFALGASVAAYTVGRALGKPCVASLGADLIQAQVMGEVLAFGVKQAARRARPEGTGYSFPSGHTTVAFASATVLQRHFGWKVGVPAYAVATYVAASRVEMKRHYLSDVAFGAALGIVAGRTVPIGRGHGLMVTPLVTDSGAGAGFTWVGRR